MHEFLGFLDILAFLRFLEFIGFLGIVGILGLLRIVDILVHQQAYFAAYAVAHLGIDATIAAFQRANGDVEHARGYKDADAYLDVVSDHDYFGNDATGADGADGTNDVEGTNDADGTNSANGASGVDSIYNILLEAACKTQWDNDDF